MKLEILKKIADRLDAYGFTSLVKEYTKNHNEDLSQIYEHVGLESTLNVAIQSFIIYAIADELIAIKHKEKSR